MLRGIGGFEKDNTLAYSDLEETPEQRKAREHEEIESKREAEAVAASQRREDLAKILIEHRANIDAAAGELTEEDLEHIHGERELDKLDRGLVSDHYPFLCNNIRVQAHPFGYLLLAPIVLW